MSKRSLIILFIYYFFFFFNEGVTSKATAIDLHYGDITCQFNSTTLSLADIPEQKQCETAKSLEL